MEAFQPRKYVIQAIIILVAVSYVMRLGYLQLIDQTSKTQASDIGIKTIYPARGLVFDRNGLLIVANDPVYELQVVQSQLKDLDTLKLCRLLEVSIELVRERFAHLKANPRIFSRFKPEPFLSNIPGNIFARFEEHLYEFPGFFTQVKIARKYSYNA